ncbi:MAG: [protein-PII] uridylyltransferase, partial [Verrucomicrobia bacterium]|nr:[protein-PII] uridylyltransferase [Verrucomicrobiota bacterium]
EMSAALLDSLATRAKSALASLHASSPSRKERLTLVKAFLHAEEKTIREQHHAGAGGVEIASLRASLLDHILRALFAASLADQPNAEKIALVANGGYGRGLLSPCSDLDLLFLLPQASHRLPKALSEVVEGVLYVLWDIGFKVGHASRSMPECIREARLDPVTRTSLFDSRLLHGDQALYDEFKKRFRKDCIERDQEKFFNERRSDINSRYRKYSNTVFLQEPNIKESPGGMRDFHNLLWISDALFKTRDLRELVKRKILTENACLALEEGFDFLHRVRNELHYHTNKGSDILTLRFQGIIADALHYPQQTILRRIETLMRDYYRHTRNIHQRTHSVFEIAQIEANDFRKGGIARLFSRTPKMLSFTGFYAKEGRLYPRHDRIFHDNPVLLMRLFRHCQRENLTLAPELRKLIKANWNLIEQDFRYHTDVRSQFRGILQRKGEVAPILRMMHRTGVLGRYLPEFGALECLVQHEFFHRYTADEHTLRCIDQLDALMESDDPAKAHFRKLFIDIEDPYALYLALILHDTGRAENVREHIDGSAMLANRLCKRLQITGGRRKLIMFLVDHHLTLWRFATKKDIQDPDVIAEFGALMKEPHLLDTLLLFTYVDSNGTNDEAWNPWKEALILQLYRATQTFLRQGYEQYDAAVREELATLRDRVGKSIGSEFDALIAEHFGQMPKRYFRYRSATNVGTHIRAISQYIQRRAEHPDTPFESAIQWIETPDHGFTEFTMVTRDRPLLLEKLCCALASEEISILSADIYTRPDGIVLDILRVCRADGGAVESRKQQLRVVDKIYKLCSEEAYDPDDYLVVKTNYLRETNEDAIPFPVRAFIDNESDPNFTVIEVQAIDRIGLMHDLLYTINKHGLQTTHARIATEKGAALDTLYISTGDGKRVRDRVILDSLQDSLNELIGIRE